MRLSAIATVVLSVIIALTVASVVASVGATLCHTEQEGRDQPVEAERTGDSSGDADGSEQEALLYDLREHAGTTRTERHANTDLSAPLGNHVRENAGGANGGKQERHDRKRVDGVLDGDEHRWLGTDYAVQAMTDPTRSALRRTLVGIAVSCALLPGPFAGVSAQAPAPTPAAPPPPAPVGNAAQLMRGIFFPNSNLIFTVQTHDPAEPPVPTAGTQVSDGFSFAAWGAGIYTGWQVVDHAAIALIDVSPLLLAPGLTCENGRDAPVTDSDWIRFTNDMIAVATQTYAASRERNRELVSELTGALSDSCAACHRAYRDVRPARGRGAGAAAGAGAALNAGRCQSRGQ